MTIYCCLYEPIKSHPPIPYLASIYFTSPFQFSKLFIVYVYTRSLDFVYYYISFDRLFLNPEWLNCLPIKGDVIEAKAVHELLSVMIERQVKLHVTSISHPISYLLSFDVINLSHFTGQMRNS